MILLNWYVFLLNPDYLGTTSRLTPHLVPSKTICYICDDEIRPQGWMLHAGDFY
jgi:hypothetical protein